MSYIPFAILLKHTFTLDAYGDLVGTIRSHGHEVSKSPIGTPLTVLPFYAFYALVDGHVTPQIVSGLGKLSAGLLTTVASAFAYLTFVALRVRRSLALFGALLLGLATESASIGSQGMWQQTGEAFWLGALVLSLAYIWNGSTRLWPYPISGLATGMVAMSRVQDIVIALPLLAVTAGRVYRSHGQRGGKLALVAAGIAPCAALQLFYNLRVFHALFATGYANDNGGTLASFDGPLLTGLRGMLFGPSKGWVVYTPWAVVGFALLICCWLRSTRQTTPSSEAGLVVAAALVCLPYTLLLAKYFRWPGGYTYGPRYEMDIDLLLVLVLVWSLEMLLPSFSVRGQRLFPRRTVFLGALVVPLVIWSGFLQYLGIFVPGGFRWNEVATTADLYSWSRSQLVYYIRTFVASQSTEPPKDINANISLSNVIFTAGTNPLGNSDPTAPRVSCFVPGASYWGFLTLKNLGPDSLVGFPGANGLGNFLVSYHLYMKDRVLTYTGQTSNLMSSLEPGGSVQVEVQISTPQQPGRYTYVFTGLQEGVKWFQPAEGTSDAADVILTVTPTCPN
jgi:hypothetical protein